MTPEERDVLVRLRRAKDRMDRDYASGLQVAEVARTAYMSPAHFSRQFKAAYGETPHAYLMTRRIERATYLLRGGSMSVTEVCLAVGCSSLGSFSARFTEVMGETPTSYRERDHGSLDELPGCVTRVISRPRRVRRAS
jgi:AraC-like DNA-binding protein